MKISRRLLKRSALLSGFYLSFILLVFYIIFNHLFFESQKENLQAEVKSISKLIEQNYGIGNLISLKRNLSNIAYANKWSESSFVNIDNIKYWEFKSSDNPSEGFNLLWTIVTFITLNTNFPPYLLQKSIKIESWDKKVVGSFSLKRSIKKEWQSHLSRMLLIGLLLMISWLLYQFFIWYVSQKTLKPLELLSEELNTSAKQVKIEFQNEVGVDELQRIRGWFNQIAQAWKSERNRAVENERLASIGQTTSTLAHDIRRPFTLVRTILSSFEVFKDDQPRLNSAKQDVEKAISGVEAMVNDIMDFSREVKIQTKPTSLGGIFDFTIRQTLQSYPDPDIKLSYQLTASKKPLIDEDRLSRVFQNIIGNGVEAITVIGKKQAGTIFIETNDINKNNSSWVEIIIGNDGPPFPEGAVGKLFESFYTANKAKGTGLGLASAQKIVHLHDGVISARNKPNNTGVEFVIHIPASSEEEQIDTKLLPKDSKEVFNIEEENLSELDKLLEKVVSSQSTYKILLLEDEHLYRAWVKNLLIKNEKLHKSVVLFDASTVEEALDLLKDNPDISYSIIDIDLGQVKDGYDFLEAVRNNNKLSCLVHSNRTLPEFRKKATDLGAKAFIPKPLPLESLIGFLAGEEFKGEKPKSLLPQQKSIYYCDDVALMRDHFEMLCKQYQADRGREINFQIFKNGEKLLTKAKEKQPHLVLSDLNMAEANGQLNGYEVIKSIKEVSGQIKAYLVSNEPLALSEEPTKEAGGDGALEQPMSREMI